MGAKRSPWWQVIPALSLIPADTLQIMNIGHHWAEWERVQEHPVDAHLDGLMLAAQLVEHYLLEEQRDHLNQSPRGGSTYLK